jgi:hypothetical protein
MGFTSAFPIKILKIIFYIEYIRIFSYISRDCSVEFDKYYSISLSCTLNQRMTLAITAIVAAAALATVAFAAPQQVMAGGHQQHNKGIRVNQEINQLNACTNQAYCVNLAENQAHIGH